MAALRKIAQEDCRASFAGISRRFAGRTVAAILMAMLVSACAGGQTLDGDISGGTFTIYTYKPDKPGKYPGLLILHTIAGLQQHVLEYASKISKHGYVAVVVDYKSGWRGRLGNRYRIYDAYQYLKTFPGVDAGRIGIVGFSLGPRHALSMANDSVGALLSTGERVEPKIKVIVSYYVGRLRLVMGNTSGFEAILFLHGDRDFETPVADVELFCRRVVASGRVCEMEIYPGAMHGFDHASTYGGTNAKVTAKAFARSVRFLETHLK